MRDSIVKKLKAVGVDPKTVGPIHLQLQDGWIYGAVFVPESE